MKNVEIKGKKYKLGFTFNSFKYIEDVDIRVLEEIESKPFKAFTLMGDLFYGAINNDPSKEFDKEKSDKLLVDYVTEVPVPEILELLIQELDNSAFFKSLQKK